jgi:hypothetical protein
MFLTCRAYNTIIKFTTASPTVYPIVIKRLIGTASNKGDVEIAVIQLPRDSTVLFTLSLLFYQ